MDTSTLELDLVAKIPPTIEPGVGHREVDRTDELEPCGHRERQAFCGDGQMEIARSASSLLRSRIVVSSQSR